MDSELKFENIKDLENLLDELIPSVRNSIIKNALRKSARQILNQAKRNFKSVKKGTSRNNYKDFNKSFKVKFKKDGMGVVLGSDYYKSLWLEKGTKDRYTRKKGAYRGSIEPTKFFENAVNQEKGNVEKELGKSVIDSLNKTVQKFNKK